MAEVASILRPAVIVARRVLMSVWLIYALILDKARLHFVQTVRSWPSLMGRRAGGRAGGEEVPWFRASKKNGPLDHQLISGQRGSL